nr:DUF2892 domain-containing protein [Alkalihalobacillus pseudalcaliphilus]
MKQNVGTIDRIVRVIIAFILLSLFFLLEGKMKYLGLIGIIPLVVTVIKYCPLYTVLRINTCTIKQ